VTQGSDDTVAILVLTSAGGSPGVTTLAVGLALTWPRPVLLADCDPGAHQAILAGYLAGQSSQGKGLLRVAEAHRDRRPLREVVIDQCLPLADEGGERRLFLPGFTKPGSAGHFGAVWEDLADAFDRLGDVDLDVIVDAGRIGPLGLPVPLVERSALTALVLGSSLRAVLSARVHLPVITEHHPSLSPSTRHQFGLVVVGEGQPYGRGEISKALGLPVVAEVAHGDPQVASHLSDGRARPRRFDSSNLIRSIRGTASSLARTLQRSTELVRS
jgi:hypothetical protein